MISGFPELKIPDYHLFAISPLHHFYIIGLLVQRPVFIWCLSRFILKPAETTGTEQAAAPSRTGGAAQNWAPLALSNGKLLIRDKSRLMCVKVAK